MVIPGAGRVGRTNALLILAPLVLVVADLVVYGVLLTSQGGPPPDSAAIVPFVSGYMLLMAVVLALTLGGQPFLVTMRPAMLAATAAGLLLLGFFALFSIGLPLFVAGILAAIAGLRAALAGRSLRNALLAEGAAAANRGDAASGWLRGHGADHLVPVERHDGRQLVRLSHWGLPLPVRQRDAHNVLRRLQRCPGWRRHERQPDLDERLLSAANRLQAVAATHNETPTGPLPL